MCLYIHCWSFLEICCQQNAAYSPSNQNYVVAKQMRFIRILIDDTSTKKTENNVVQGLLMTLFCCFLSSCGWRLSTRLWCWSLAWRRRAASPGTQIDPAPPSSPPHCSPPSGCSSWLVVLASVPSAPEGWKGRACSSITIRYEAGLLLRKYFHLWVLVINSLHF